MQIFRGLLAVAGSLLLLVGCTDDPTAEITPARLPTRTVVPSTDTPAPPVITPTITPTPFPAPDALNTEAAPSGNGAALGPNAQAQINRVIADLAAEQDVAPTGIRLLSLETFFWRDAGWGCAALADDLDGDSAVTDPTRGYRIVLGINQRMFVYHTDDGDGIALCPDRQWLALEGNPVPLDPIAESIVDLVRADAARRLELANASQVRVVSLIVVNWPDSSLGCPRPGIEYEDTPTLGYRTVVEGSGTRLIYHTSIRDILRCTADEEILPGALRLARPDSTPEPTPSE